VSGGPDDDMKDVARQLSPLVDISLDQTGRRTNDGWRDLGLPDQRERRGNLARDTAENQCDSLQCWKLSVDSACLSGIFGTDPDGEVSEAFVD
jgi:hypothetical protein